MADNGQKQRDRGHDSAQEFQGLRTDNDRLERENRDLKRSVYELSYKLTQLEEQSGQVKRPYDIDSMLEDGVSNRAEYEVEKTSIEQGHSSRRDEDGLLLYPKSILKNHTGAVYTTKFSPCGRLLASGSFDKSVRIWDMISNFQQQQVSCLAEHQQLVSDLSWSNDSLALLSGSFDHTIKLWDVHSSVPKGSYTVTPGGFVQAVEFDPSDNNIFFAGTTQRMLHMYDVRSGQQIKKWTNNAMVNALYVFRDGTRVITGDSKGVLKTWDVRGDACVAELSHHIEQSSQPISDVHTSPPLRAGGEEGRLLAVNCYDNIIRVFDRGSLLISQREQRSQMQLVHFLEGHKNKNWPIKSSFFRGNSYEMLQQEHVHEDQVGDREPDISSIHRSMLLATGSADNRVYLYNVSGSEGTAEIVQRLEGHRDRVYGAEFHPFEPVLASCSADFTVRIWAKASKANR
jgi:COMPASS component SWD3